MLATVLIVLLRTPEAPVVPQAHQPVPRNELAASDLDVPFAKGTRSCETLRGRGCSGPRAQSRVANICGFHVVLHDYGPSMSRRTLK